MLLYVNLNELLYSSAFYNVFSVKDQNDHMFDYFSICFNEGIVVYAHLN